jgi:hypothetical protein
MLYEQNGYISLDHLETIAFELHQECKRITSVLKDFDLFKFEGDKFYSESVLKRIEIRADKSKKASSAAHTRWTIYADALQTQCKGNAIKVNKRKVNKKEIKEDNNTWRNSFEIYLTECKAAYNSFVSDNVLMERQKELNPGINVLLSIKKGFENFWGTEAGWNHKKKSRVKSIDWKLTIINSIDLNKVYLPRGEQEVKKDLTVKQITYRNVDSIT